MLSEEKACDSSIFVVDEKLEAEFEFSFPAPLTKTYRLFHSSLYGTGVVLFLFGSLCYAPPLGFHVVGGCTFTVGSAALFVADLGEYWINNRAGCLCDAAYGEVLEESIAKEEDYSPMDTWRGQLQRAEIRMNFGMSVLGSFLYLVGSVLFIPSLGCIEDGTIIFIAGSLVIFGSMSWKVSD